MWAESMLAVVTYPLWWVGAALAFLSLVLFLKSISEPEGDGEERSSVVLGEVGCLTRCPTGSACIPQGGSCALRKIRSRSAFRSPANNRAASDLRRLGSPGVGV